MQGPSGQAGAAPDRRGTPSASHAAGRIGWFGRLGAPVLALAVYLAMQRTQASEDAARTAALGTLMAVLWMTEAIPLPATSLLPLALAPLLGLGAIEAVAGPYANPVIFLFMGGFMLALAMEKWGLHRRIALLTLRVVGASPRMLVGGFMLSSAVLSMWISNTATAVMMLPIAVSVIALAVDRLVADRTSRGEDIPDMGNASPPDQARLLGAGNFATCLMLAVAYGASVGGVGTVIGTPPNAFLKGWLQDNAGIEVGFGQWMLLGVPLATVFLFLTWIVLTYLVFPIRLKGIPGGKQLIRDELAKLGRMSRGEWAVFLVFMLTATLWITRDLLASWEALVRVAPFVANLSDANIAMLAAIALFVIPVSVERNSFALDWETAVRLPWGVLLLFGGGLSLAGLVKSSGLDAWIGSQVGQASGLPPVLLVLLIVTVVIFLTELTSNTATAATFLPILGGVAGGIGVDSMLLVVPAALAASYAFMMPVATPPNAIVYGSGHVTIGQMMRAGVVLNVMGIVLITLATYTLGAWFLDINTAGGAHESGDPPITATP